MGSRRGEQRIGMLGRGRPPLLALLMWQTPCHMGATTHREQFGIFSTFALLHSQRL